MTRKIPFDKKNIGYLVCWNNHSRDNEGYTLVKNIESFKGKIEWRNGKDDHYHGLEQSNPTIMQFRDLKGFLKGKDQKWVTWQSEFPRCRKLTKKELKIMYDGLKHKIIKNFSPEEQVEEILPMFYDEDKYLNA